MGAILLKGVPAWVFTMIWLSRTSSLLVVRTKLIFTRARYIFISKRPFVRHVTQIVLVFNRNFRMQHSIDKSITDALTKIWAWKKMVATFYWNRVEELRVCRRRRAIICITNVTFTQIFVLSSSSALEFSPEGWQPKMGCLHGWPLAKWNFWSSGTSKRIEFFFSEKQHTSSS